MTGELRSVSRGLGKIKNLLLWIQNDLQVVLHIQIFVGRVLEFFYRPDPEFIDVTDVMLSQQILDRLLFEVITPTIATLVSLVQEFDQSAVDDLHKLLLYAASLAIFPLLLQIALFGTAP